MNVYVQLDNSFGLAGFAVAAGVAVAELGGQNKIAEESDSCHS